jgi:hypothetical protein
MAYTVTISNQSGETPVSYYVCTVSGDNCQYLGNTTGTYALSPLFQTANVLYIKAVDSIGCVYFTIYNC